MVKKYGQTVLVTQDLSLENYLEKLVHAGIVEIISLTVTIRILKQVNSK